MPGWPNVGRADDHRLLEALRQADAHAPASLYDAYADRLTDYAYTGLRDLDAAADAVHDAMVTAQSSVHRLKEPVRLRAWLYALTRFQCAARAAGRTPTGPAPMLEDAEDPELALAVHEALGELSRQEREVLELTIRHGLAPAEVGAVLGLTARQTAGRLARSRDHLENVAAAVVLARIGRAHCPELSAMLDSWDGPLSALLRQKLTRHIPGCELCLEGRQKHIAAGRLLDLVPIMYAPLSLRRRVVDTCVNPDRDQTRVLITERADRFDPEGFPVTTEFKAKRGRRGKPERRRARGRRRALPIVLALACAVAAAGSLAWVSGQEAAGSIRIEAMPPPSAEPQLAIPSDGPIQEPEPTPEPTPVEEDQEPAATAVPESTPAAPATVAPRPTPKPTPKPTRTRGSRPTTPALSLSCPGDMGDTNADVIWVTARNAPITWTATVSGGATISARRGALKAGATGRVTLSVNDPDEAGSATIAFRSAGGNPTCKVWWRGEDAQTPPDGVPDPTTTPRAPSPSPSPTPTVPAAGEPT
ncbi:RNA polymerase sigma factor [Acrocarpospora corrugata]|uniref:RNA polymerase sigma factor n=1 Tax=Acrocarpospora corrugata TaxID=35763 RepID=UPI0012D2D34E|nr:sigma-70 family RNA polymerase sigma factor [Acrocarpospora corrugata]